MSSPHQETAPSINLATKTRTLRKSFRKAEKTFTKKSEVEAYLRENMLKRRESPQKTKYGCRQQFVCARKYHKNVRCPFAATGFLTHGQIFIALRNEHCHEVMPLPVEDAKRPLPGEDLLQSDESDANDMNPASSVSVKMKPTNDDTDFEDDGRDSVQDGDHLNKNGSSSNPVKTEPTNDDVDSEDDGEDSVQDINPSDENESSSVSVKTEPANDDVDFETDGDDNTQDDDDLDNNSNTFSPRSPLSIHSASTPSLEINTVSSFAEFVDHHGGALMKIAMDMKLVLGFDGSHAATFLFHRHSSNAKLLFTALQNQVKVETFNADVTVSTQMWQKSDDLQFLAAVQGICFLTFQNRCT